MSQLCKTCDGCHGCYCPRCPKNPNPCNPCTKDEDEATILTEHYECSGEMFCQICVETEKGVKFTHQMMGMYCDEHEDAHKARMRDELQKDVARRT
jgi:hypothetical protein